MGSLDGKVAVVTGAGTGLGREHALALAADGARIIVNDMSDAADETVGLITAAGGQAEAHKASVAEWSTGEALVDHAVDSFGDLHIMVNNAGVLRDAMSFSMDEATWDLVVDVHLKGHFICSRAAGSYWRNQTKAGSEAPRRLIHTASESGLFGAAGQTHYSSAKGGILSLSLTLGRELAKYGVTTNTIAPRARTPMTTNQPSMVGPEDSDAFDWFDPANVSPLVVWLCTDEAQDVNGQTFIVGSDGVWLMRRFSQVRGIRNDGRRWTVEELSARRYDLFADDDPGLPGFEAPSFKT